MSRDDRPSRPGYDGRSMGSVGGRSQPGAPSLSNPSAGAPTSDGTVGAAVTTSQPNGYLFWAVVTNTGSATTAQLKAGSGGNIVSGKAGNQVVNSAAAQTIPTITGLSGATTYQIKFLQTNQDGLNSAQASVDLVTL